MNKMVKPYILLSILFTGLTSLLSGTNNSDDTEIMRQVAAEILNQLKSAKGILPHEAPILTKVYPFRGDGKLASMYLEQGEIHLDSRTYLICRSMGKDSLDALAFLMGHELGHFIHKHGGINHNISGAAPQEMTQFEAVRNIISTNEVSINTDFENRMEIALSEYRETHNEAEADFEGAFLGYLAGFCPLEAGKTFLQKAYVILEIDTISKGYPRLSERLAIIEKTSKELESLTPLFELSQYLVAVGQYADAIPILEKVLEKFESPEIYNNIGVISLLHILSLYERPLIKYRIPLTLDANFRAPHPQVYSDHLALSAGFIENDMINTGPCDQTEVQQLVTQSEEYFQKAIHLNREYALAYMNLSIAQLIQSILYDITYRREGTMHYDYSQCITAQKSELSKAKGNISQALLLCQQLLTGHCIEYFSLSPNDSVTLYSLPFWINSIFPNKYRSLPTGNIDRDRLMFSITDQESLDSLNKAIESLEEQNQYYPSLLECFGSISYGQQLQSFNLNYSRWATEDYSIPKEGILLSDIITQQEIIHLYNEERHNDSLKYEYPPPVEILKKGPFERSLEINPNSEIAKYNYYKYHNIEHPQDTSTSVTTCDKAELSSKRIIDSLISSTTWQYKDTLNQSRLTAFYKHGKGISDFEIDLIYRNELLTKQYVSYSTNDNYLIYMNNTEVENGVKEEVVFLLPLSQNQTSCSIQKDASLRSVKKIYGTSIRSFSTTNGSLKTYRQFHDKTDQIEISEPDVWGITRPNVLYRQYVENGTIFKMNHSNNVNHWLSYYKIHQSEPKEMR